MRSAGKTKVQILDAARQILAREGFGGLGVNALAAEAGVGKPLIYRYFGNMEGVAAALAQDSGPEGVALACENSAEAMEALIGYGRGLAGDRTRRDLLAWSLAAGAGPAYHAPGPEAGTRDVPLPVSGDDPAAVMAILQAASTFLLLCRDRHGVWGGLPLGEPRHMARLERAMAAIMRATLSEPKLL